jgi:hypothetical protein
MPMSTSAVFAHARSIFPSWTRKQSATLFGLPNMDTSRPSLAIPQDLSQNDSPSKEPFGGSLQSLDSSYDTRQD